MLATPAKEKEREEWLPDAWLLHLSTETALELLKLSRMVIAKPQFASSDECKTCCRPVEEVRVNTTESDGLTDNGVTSNIS